jgi:hypothetical protein
MMNDMIEGLKAAAAVACMIVVFTLMFWVVF